MRPTGASNEAALPGCHDRPAIGIPEGNDAARVSDQALEEREHEPRPRRDEGCNGRKAILSRLLGGTRATLESAVPAIHQHIVPAIPVRRRDVELGEDPIGAAIGEHLQKALQSLPLFSGQVRASLRFRPRFDHAAKEVLLGRIDGDAAPE